MCFDIHASSAGTLLLMLLIIHMAGPALSRLTVRCNGEERTLPVMSQATGILYSPNYPHRYLNSEECKWLLTTSETDQVIEIQVTDMDLEKDESDTCLDFLAAYDGDSDSSPLLKKWCGKDKTVVRSTGQKLFLVFVSNDLVRHKGFVLKYRTTAPYSSQCVEGEVKTLEVTENDPVLLQLSDLNHTRSCQWRLSGSGDVRLVMEVVHFMSGLSCRDGNLTIHDGGNVSSVEVARWCGGASGPPFSLFYASGREVFITTTILPPEERQFRNVALDLWVQIRAVPERDDCNMNSPAVLEFQDAPLYFPIPFTSLSGGEEGEECTVRVHATGEGDREDDGGYRVDIVTTGDRQARCEDIDNPVVWISDGKRVEAECWRDEHPVYWTHTQRISVLPRHNVTSFLRVQLTTFPCTGYVIDRLYSGSHSITNTIRDIGYPRNAQCQFLIEGTDGNHPVVQIRTDLLGEEGCGDSLTIYNGSTTEGEVLLKHCGSEDRLIKKQVVSPSTAMLVVFSTDDDDTFGDGVDIKYYSVPESDVCGEGPRELHATSETQILQSPNFPSYYHLNYDCFYKIRTNRSGEVIHVKLTSTSFESSHDFLQFIDHGTRDNQLGKVSGADRLREFTSTNQGMTVRFYSDENLSDGGWRLEYRSVKPSQLEASADDMAFNQMTIIVAGGLGVVILILILIIIVMCCKNRDSTPPTHL